jgi:hypothetical protein
LRLEWVRSLRVLCGPSTSGLLCATADLHRVSNIRIPTSNLWILLGPMVPRWILRGSAKAFLWWARLWLRQLLRWGTASGPLATVTSSKLLGLTPHTAWLCRYPRPKREEAMRQLLILAQFSDRHWDELTNRAGTLRPNRLVLDPDRLPKSIRPGVAQ